MKLYLSADTDPTESHGENRYVEVELLPDGTMIWYKLVDPRGNVLETSEKEDHDDNIKVQEAFESLSDHQKKLIYHLIGKVYNGYSANA